MEALAADDPSRIGEYELRARLGEGGFGRVYLGLSPGGRAVAVKVVLAEIARDREFLQRFQFEVAAARRVNGTYTAAVVGAGLSDRPPWVATAFVPGPSLQDAVVKYGPLPEPAVWRLLAGLVEALQDIHACGLVHRDLKPQNVLLASDGPRVIDFGISKAADGIPMTSTGAVFGTPSFMSPEQAEGEAVGPASDIFALGCVLAYAATGTVPFGGGTAASVLYRVVHAAPSLDGVPLGLRSVLESCLAKTPAQRPSLADLARPGRNGPGGMSARLSAAFWPAEVAQQIRDYEERVHAVGGVRPQAAAPAVLTHLPTAPAASPAPAHPASPSAQGSPSTASMPPRSPYAGQAWPRQPEQSGAPYAYPAGSPKPLTPQVARTAGTSRVQPPPSVRSAFVAMLVGAALAVFSAVCVSRGIPIAYGPGHVYAWGQYVGESATVPGIIAYVLICGIWLLTAFAGRAARNWSRVVGTVCFFAFTLAMAQYFLNRNLLILDAEQLLPATNTGNPAAIAVGTLGGLVSVTMGLVGLIAIVLLWRGDSNTYFRDRAR